MGDLAAALPQFQGMRESRKLLLRLGGIILLDYSRRGRGAQCVVQEIVWAQIPFLKTVRQDLGGRGDRKRERPF
jgi:hypothetical protein